MVLMATLIITVAAAAIWALAVPRAKLIDPEAPALGELVCLRSTAVVALFAFATAQVLWLVPEQRWWLLVGYLAAGSPLVAVDFLTTYLPTLLQRIAAGFLLPGLGWLAMHDPAALIGALLGGALAYGFFWVAWRLSRQLGYGDVRLAGLLGVAAGQAGTTMIALALVCGTMLGMIAGIGHLFRRRRTPGLPAHFAYGPALWLGAPVGYALAPLIA